MHDSQRNSKLISNISIQITVRGLTVLAFFLFMPGCITSQEKGRELARVAKDWCLSIRASQVIPVYPLTQDLIPGDVFLTSTSIGEEVRLFEEKGFLPLDQHMVRLDIDDVSGALQDFYAGRFDESNHAFPTKVAWDAFPSAKFPTYSFEISRSGGLSLAVPVQGVPVGFNFLGAAAATGTIAISDATTIGLDIDRLDPLVEDWANERRSKLSAYGSFENDPPDRRVFLRVITRVYYTRKVDIQLMDKNASGSDLAVGFDIPLAIPGNPQQTSTNAELFEGVVDKLNASLQAVQIGGKVKVVTASRRSIGLTETFDRPVVIGYLAYDRRILADGTLSPPVSTLVRVRGGTAFEPLLMNFESGGLITAWYTKDEPKRLPMIRAWIDQNLPGTDAVEFLSLENFAAARARMIRDLNIR